MLGFLVFGEGIALLSGQFDLSLAQNAGLSAVLTGTLANTFPFLPGWSLIIIIILIGLFLGSINGYLAGARELNPFLITLGTYLTFHWLTYAIRRSTITDLPKLFLYPGGGKIGGVPVAIFIFLGGAIFLYYFLQHTRVGFYIYSIGSSRTVSLTCGIKVQHVKFLVFTLAGLLAGISGLLYSGFVGAITVTIAEGKIFDAFAAAILGGISLAGGRGSIINTVGGALFLGTVVAGLQMLAIPPAVRGVVTGILVIAAVIINQFRSTLRDRILAPSS